MILVAASGEMIMVAIFAFIDAKMSANMVVILGDTRSQLGFFASGIAYFVLISYPTTLRLIDTTV